MTRFFVGARTDLFRKIMEIALRPPGGADQYNLIPEEARALADQLLSEAAFCENWQVVIDRQEEAKRERTLDG